MLRTAQIPQQKIDELCLKYGVKELAVVSDTFHQQYGNGHDAEILVEYLPEAGTTIPDFYDLEDELKKIFHKDIFLISKDGVRPQLKDVILQDRRQLYAKWTN